MLAVRPQPGHCPGPRSSEAGRGVGSGDVEARPQPVSCHLLPSCTLAARVSAAGVCVGPPTGPWHQRKAGEGMSPSRPALGGSCRPLVSLWRHCRKKVALGLRTREPACLGQVPTRLPLCSGGDWWIPERAPKAAEGRPGSPSPRATRPFPCPC